MENEDHVDHLLVTEVFTPAGHWSSYPSHRHDEDDFPRITYLEETYYHRLKPENGFGIQRVYTDDHLLDETLSVSNGDVVLVPRGHHPCAAPYGTEMNETPSKFIPLWMNDSKDIMTDLPSFPRPGGATEGITS